MVSFSYYYFNARSSHLIYLSTLLTLTTYYPFSSVFILSLLDGILGYHEWNKFYKATSNLEFTIAWELRRESSHYKSVNVMLHTGVLLPYALLWLLSYGQNCIGVSVLAYALFIYVATIKSILNYDGAAHKGLDPKLARNIHVDVAPTDSTNFVLNTLTYLSYEEEKEGHQFKSVSHFAMDPKYTHVAWRMVKEMSTFDLRQLRTYLLSCGDNPNN